MIYYSCKGDRTMEIKDYDKDRATVLNAFYQQLRINYDLDGFRPKISQLSLRMLVEAFFYSNQKGLTPTN